MALVEKTIIDKIEVVGEFKHVQVREDRQIIDNSNDEIKSRGNYFRYVLSPDADISGQPAEVQAIANAAWTDEVKAAFIEHKNSAPRV
jgi:hypothetical protein